MFDFSINSQTKYIYWGEDAPQNDPKLSSHYMMVNAPNSGKKRDKYSL
jgi:hypothetical protein